MTDPVPTAERQRKTFFHQAGQCDGRSPLYARLCRALADEPLVAEIAPDMRWDLPLRLLGGVHNLVLRGRASWDDVPAALAEHPDFLALFVAERGVQTNEVQRSWLLVPCFLEVARRTGRRVFDLVELGPSAGLNLVWDRYRYRYQAGTWGPREAGLELGGEERHPVAGELLAMTLDVRERVGVDVDPIDLTTDDGELLLKSFVWADQAWRIDLLDRAVAELRRAPPELVRGDFVELLPNLLERRRAGALTVVFQTASMSYLVDEQQAKLHASLEAAGRDESLAFVSTDRPADDVHHFWGLVVTTWPGGDREIVAHADFHGVWLDWRHR